MQIKERAFSGKIFRPKPHPYLSSNKELLTVITPWGQEAITPENVFESLESLYSRLSEDKESTHPFPKLTSLNPTQNNMRTAILQTQEDIFNNINQEEYAMGFELFFATTVDNILTWTQIGQPFLFIDRPSLGLQSIGQTMDMSLNLWTNLDRVLPPLPYQLMGIQSDLSFSSFCFRFHPEDKLILLSRSAIPTSWFGLKKEERTLDNLSQKAAEDNPHIPFWLAIVDFNTKSV